MACGWHEIGDIRKSGRASQRYAREGMPFFKDPAGRPIAKPSMTDEYILDLNQSSHDDKTWRDEGIDMALGYEEQKYKGKRRGSEGSLTNGFCKRSGQCDPDFDQHRKSECR